MLKYKDQICNIYIYIYFLRNKHTHIRERKMSSKRVFNLTKREK